MGRMMPVSCELHHQTIDWGDFGECQGFCDEVHPDDLDNCPDSPGCSECEALRPKWSREDLQRVLYHVVDRYRSAAVLGGDDELLRSAIFDVAIPTLKDNHWWPEGDEWGRDDYDAQRPRNTRTARLLRLLGIGSRHG